ncbi:MAG: family 10 glycosylhydrolase, partial [Prolixibacteraceae bacterium]|nr:family 10 glycosylhydrolase [Prolixibacteraceae bacterium]
VTKDFDPVGYILPQMKKRGIAFYAMFVNARVIKSLPWYNEDWIIIGPDGKQEGNDERGYRINYCNPAVREHEKSVMLNFAKRFPEADGIQFDYIRFPWQRDYPYNQDTRKIYKDLTGIDPLDLEIKKEQWEPEEHEQLFETWRNWRKQQITSLVREVSKELREIDRNMQLCASVLAQPKWIETACQDWPRWVNEGLIDFAKPMFYHSDDELYRQKIAWYRSFAQNENYWKKIIPSASGNVRSDDPIVKSGSVRDEAYIPEQGTTPLPTEEEARAKLVVNKVHLMREAGLPGVNYFTLRSMSDDVVKMLHDGAWKNPVKCYVPPRRRDPGDQL